jgi:Ni2+-binding GTPase involved in maturation of urease and hydrogenase
LKLVVVAGTPGSGKTSVLIHTVRTLLQSKILPAVVKIDCLWTEDDQRFKKLGVPVTVGLSRDMCPDHFSIYNVDEMLEWAKDQKADVLLNETAGLCLRCAPYPDRCLAVCVIDVTTGPNSPLKVGPLLTTADVVVTTKGDMVSQAEREVFRERILEANPNCRIVEANGLSGKGSVELAEIIKEMPEANREMVLRHNPPLAICTLCSGELRVAKEHHRGVLRHLEGFMEYSGE